MDRDEYGRLVRAEVTLEVLEERIDDVQLELRAHRTDSARRQDELRSMIESLGVKLDASKFSWRSLLNKDTAKVAIAIASGLIGGGGAASIVKALFNE